MENKNNYLIPVAIVIAGAFIAVAIFMGGSFDLASLRGNAGEVADSDTSGDISVRPVDSQDHILGSLDAPVKIIEFSDLECPYCQGFHWTMQQIVEEYDGQVAWVYRHMPLVTLHSKASREAEASECADYLGGNDAFWAYIDRLFEITPANNGLADIELYNIAEYIDLDSAAFADCLDSNKFAEKVQDQTQESTSTVASANNGRVGTPFSIVIAPNGKTFPLSGAQPYSAVKSLIDLALQEK